MKKKEVKTFIWLITSRCNNKCRHCYAAKFSDGELSPEETLRVINEAKKVGVSHIGFTGGEFFLRLDALNLLEECTQREITTSVVTNGSLLSQEVVRKIKENKTSIYLSLDGHTRQIHEFIRGKGSWKKALSAIKELVSQGVPFTSVIALNKVNYRHIFEYIHFVKRLGSASVALIPVMLSGRAEREILLNSSEIVWVIKEAAKAAEETKFKVSLWCLPFAEIVVTSPYLTNPFYCRGKMGEMDIDPQGNVLLCDVLDINLSNIKKGVLQAWQEQESNPLIQHLNTPQLAPPCQSCPVKEGCKGGCFARAKLLTGDIFAPDPLCPRVNQWTAK